MLAHRLSAFSAVRIAAGGVVFVPCLINRSNLRFEELDLKVPYELASWFRIYGGGGMLVGRDPKELKRGTSQAGAELAGPWTFPLHRLRQADFTTEYSIGIAQHRASARRVLRAPRAGLATRLSDCETNCRE